MILTFKDSPLWWHDCGLNYTASGYGKQIPTPYKALYQKRWYRVYCCIFANSGMLYIRSKGQLITVEKD